MSQDHITKAAESIAQVREEQPVAEAVRKRGPTVNDEIFAQVCQDLASGMSIRQASEAAGTQIWSILRYAAADANRDKVFSLARECCGESHASLIIEKAMYLLEAPDLSQAQVMAIRTALDKLQWTAARLHHKHWGEKTTTEVDLGSNFMTALQRVESAAGKIDRKRARDVEAA